MVCQAVYRKSDKEVLRSMDHVEMLKRPHLWPKNPVLPLKRQRGDGDLDYGLLFDATPETRWTVFLGLLYLVDDLTKCPAEVYTSAEEIVAAGWVVD